MRLVRLAGVSMVLAIALASLYATTGCSVTGDTQIDDPQGNPQLTISDTAVVNDAGGVAQSADGAVLDVPAGALNGPLTVQIGSVTEPGRPAWTERNVGVGRYWGPGGVEFNDAVKVTLPYTLLDLDSANDVNRIGVFSQKDGQSGWEYHAGSTIDTTAGTVTALTDHLSTFVLVLMPSSGSYGWIEGAVTDSSGNPVSGAKVTVLTAGFSTLTAEDGTYKIGYLAGARYSIKVTRSGFADQSLTADVSGKKGTTLNVTLSESAETSGAIRVLAYDAATIDPIKDAVVTVVEGPTSSGAATTDKYGVADLDGLAEGAYTIKVSAPKLADRTFGGVDVVAGEYTVVGAALASGSSGDPGSIAGHVRDRDGVPLVGARVEITSGPADQGRAVTTGAAGAYEIDALAPGDYTLRATATGYDAEDTGTVTVDSGEQTTQDFSLAPEGQGEYGALAGTVRNESGDALAGAAVLITAGPGSVGASATTDSEGNYEITSLVAGNYSLRFSATGYADVTASGVTVTSGTTSRYDVVLTSGGATTGGITGTVRDEPGGPLAGVTVQITAGPGGVGTSVQTGSDGSYALSGLTPGTYSLRFTLTGYEASTGAGITVTAGANSPYDVILIAES